MSTNTKLTKDQLTSIEIAKQHAKKAYKEGVTSMVAVLRTKKGNIYTGINIKYKAIWKCICAERVAIAKAIEAKDEDFDHIVTVKYSPKEKKFSVVNMCGECRQLAIFHAPFSVIVIDNKDIKSVSVNDVFPYPYK